VNFVELDRRTKLFVNLAALFVTCLVLGDIIGGKLLETVAFGVPFVISVGMLPFPVTFLLTDLLNEFYGKKAARYVTLVGFVMASFTFLLLFVAVRLPWAPFTRETTWVGFDETSFNRIFSGSQRMLVASMVAYLTAQLVDIGVFHFIKRLTGNRLLWLRATGSTVVSQLIDTLCIQLIAWYGLLPANKILSIIFTSYAVKVVIAFGLTPFIYAGHAFIEKRYNMLPLPAQAEDRTPVATP
jgi:queuosine precursor transporter